MAIVKSIFTQLVDKYFAPVVRRVTETKKEQELLHTTMLTEEYSPDLKWESSELAVSSSSRCCITRLVTSFEETR